MLPAMPCSPRRSMWSSTRVVSSSRATRVSQGVTLMSSCLANRTLRGGGQRRVGAVQAGGDLVDAQRGDVLGRDGEERPDQRRGTEGAFRTDAELDAQPAGR